MMRQLDLRRLILGLSMLSLLLALAGTLYASAVVQRDILLSSTLEDNRVYARKLALAADDLLANAMRDLAYGAQKIGERPDSRVIAQEVERLQARPIASMPLPMWMPTACSGRLPRMPAISSGGRLSRPRCARRWNIAAP
ncbi:hypothetical protein L535_3540 [Bordetella bronchiseptica SBL-F6116]|uniref:hypothetical protein n=1 Tax=Bordetella bronchiseptica TaxID=518 RepID=UPI0004A166BC|nr:hypothetical protein [Bordetella bronchiseptica]KDE00882.1 hypothetical protein L535_3540 [Bordetella bronchiseptica SBL-F6116]